MSEQTEAIKDRLPLPDYLRNHGVNLRKAGNRLVARCPLPGHADEHPSFQVDPAKNRFTCPSHPSGKTDGDIFAFVMLRDGIDFGKALKILASEAGVKLPPPRNSRVTSESAALELLKKRGLRDETISHFGVKADLNKASWSYPVSGGTRYKNFDSKAKPKYWNDAGLPDQLYGLDHIPEGSTDLVLANGDPAMWICWQAGVPASCATIHGEGSIAPGIIEDLKQKGITSITIVPDLDDAGRGGAAKRYRKLSNDFEVIIRELPVTLGKKADINDLYLSVGCNDHAFRDALETLPVGNPSDYLNDGNALPPETKVIPDPQPPSDEPELWEPPAVFFSEVLPEFPTKALPPCLRDYVEAVATATQTPADLAGMLVLAILAASCAKKVVVLIRPGWEEPVNIYAVIVLPPANRKTAVFADVAAPIEGHEESETKRLIGEIAEADSRCRVAKSRLEHLQNQAAKAEPDKASVLVREATVLAQEVATMVVPSMPRYVVDDCTPERLTTLLRDQGGRLAVLSAEGDIFDLMAGRYGDKGGNLGVFLRAHAGDTIRVDRVGRPPEFVRKPALTMGLAVQPEVIRGLATRPGFRGRGLLGRFLYSWPKSLLGQRAVDPPAVPGTVRQDYCTVVQKLLALPFGTADSGEVAPHVLRLTPSAGQELHRFREWLEPQLGEFGELAAMPDWGGKLAGAVVRIAGLLNMALHHTSPSPWQHPIAPTTMAAAIGLGRYFIAHARLSFCEMGTDEKVEAARYCLRWIEKSRAESFTKREALRAMHGKFKKVEDLDPALRLLMLQGYLRERPIDERQGVGRKPSPRYDVNPFVFKGEGDNSVNSVNSVTGCNEPILNNPYLLEEDAEPDHGAWPYGGATIDTIDTIGPALLHESVLGGRMPSGEFRCGILEDKVPDLLEV